MRYLIGISNYSERIALANSTNMMSMSDLVAIGVKTPRIDVGALWKKTSLN